MSEMVNTYNTPVGRGKPILTSRAVGYGHGGRRRVKSEACPPSRLKAALTRSARFLRPCNAPMSKVAVWRTHDLQVFQEFKVIGVNSLDRKQPIERYKNAGIHVFPLTTPVILGMQILKIGGVMLDDSFDPRAFVNPIRSSSQSKMEGSGLGMDNRRAG